MQYNLVSTGDQSNLTVFLDGQMLTADGTHPKWSELVAKVTSGDESGLAELFDPAVQVALEFERVSDRVSVAGGIVYLDGDPVSGTLSDHILRFMDEGLDFIPLVNFFEKVATNENPHSREHLFRWLTGRQFSITRDGNFIAYKGVRKSDDGAMTSISQGTATVDGVVHSGAIPNAVGAVVEMPRSSVEFDPANGCSTGLHAGTWDYASGFSQGAILKVSVNPRDVVSVPTDCSDQKLRTCRYVVLDVIDAPLTSALDDDDEDYDDEERDACGDCYEYLDDYGNCECDEDEDTGCDCELCQEDNSQV